MNMNRILFTLIIITFMIFPVIFVNASSEKRVNSVCQLNYEGSYSSDTCSQDILNDMLKVECRNGEFNSNKLSYTCSGNGGIKTGSTIKEACDKIENKNQGSLLILSANDICTATDENVGEFFCEEVDVLKALKFIGFIIFFLKVLVPFIIIMMATFDYYKAIIDEKDDALVKQTKVLIRRILIGIIIFFIPSLIKLSLMFVSGWSDIEFDYTKCADCLLDPISCNK
ncbi:MAG: hypothetical protein PHD03_01560 [Bacilli bacterium]|nr:hypothetical protein [Bacilli bacterium]MDD4406839.1 hypothetical protein [Bacilli bacterium]